MKKAILWVGLGYLLLVSRGFVYAYDNDTHYVFTYYLARRVGFSPTQAHQIASADVSVDYDSKVEPLQVGNVFNPWGDAQTPRVLFHAFPDSRTYDKIKEVQRANGQSEGEAGAKATEFALEERDKWQAVLWQRAKASGNPGLYLHFYQDLYSHDGFWSRFGHGAPPPLPGHSSDFLSYRPEKAQAMMRGTIEELQRFMHECLPREPRVPDTAEAQQVLDQLIAVNRHDTAENLALRYNFNGQGVPDWTKALEVVNRALAGPGGVLGQWTVYHFDAQGNPLDGNWKLDGCREPLQPGRLWVKVVADETGEPLGGAKVSVTFAGKTDVLASGTTTNGGLPALDLEIKSSGKYQVQATLPGYGESSATVEMPFEGWAIGVIRLRRAFDWSGRWDVEYQPQVGGPWYRLGVMTWRKVDEKEALEVKEKQLGSSASPCLGRKLYAAFLGDFPWGPAGAEGGKMAAFACSPDAGSLEGRYGQRRDFSSSLGGLKGNITMRLDPDAKGFHGTFIEDYSRGNWLEWRGKYLGP